MSAILIISIIVCLIINYFVSIIFLSMSLGGPKEASTKWQRRFVWIIGCTPGAVFIFFIVILFRIITGIETK